MSDSRHQIISPLTGLRVIAAYMVFFHHFPISAEFVGRLVFTMQWQGHVGVSVFFVLSGFLIAFNYADSMQLNGTWYGAYLRNRIARIYPVYFLATIIALLYLGNREAEAWIMNLTLLRGFFGDYYLYHIGQAWSLTVEMTFYLLAPGLIVLVGRIPIGALCLLFYGLGFSLTLLDFPSGSFMEPPRMVVAYTFFGRCFEFLLGIWIFKRFRMVVARQRGWATYLGASLLAGFLYFSTHANELTIFSPTFVPAHHFIFPLIVGLLIFGLWKETTLIGRFLGSRPMLVLGKASYAFYLLHAAPFKEMLGLTDAPILVHFLLINLLAITVYYVVEKPLHSLLRAPPKALRPDLSRALSAG